MRNRAKKSGNGQDVSSRDILQTVRKRTQRSSAGSIALAADYVKTVSDCFSSAGPEAYFGLGSTFQWNQTVKAAGERLVWREESGISNCQGKGAKKPNIKESDITPGACMEFDFILTSSRRDRDYDILEPAGANIDPAMPLLWQHIPIQPIGRHLKVLQQDENVVVCRAAIVDNAFGRDVAQLVAFGALRISHGFVPTEYEPIEDDEDDIPGYHVLKYNVLEASVVSIPSNMDAEIVRFEQGKLHHPLVKAWASTLKAKTKRVFPTRIPPGKKTDTKEPSVAASTVPYNPAAPVNVHLHVNTKGKADEEEPEGEPEPMAVSSHASLGRVHLMLEQISERLEAGDTEGAQALCNQAKGELEASMGEEGEEPVEAEAPEDEGKEGEEEPEEEGKEGEEEEDKDEEEDDTPKEPGQYVMEEEETEEEKEQAEGEDETTPGDSEGREDEGKSLDLADELFKSALLTYERNGVPQRKGTKKKPSSKPAGKPAKTAKR